MTEIYKIVEIGENDAMFNDSDNKDLVGAHVSLLEENQELYPGYYTGDVEILSNLSDVWEEAIVEWKDFCDTVGISHSGKRIIPFHQVKLEPIE